MLFSSSQEVSFFLEQIHGLELNNKLNFIPFQIQQQQQQQSMVNLATDTLEDVRIKAEGSGTVRLSVADLQQLLQMCNRESAPVLVQRSALRPPPPPLSGPGGPIVGQFAFTGQFSAEMGPGQQQEEVTVAAADAATADMPIIKPEPDDDDDDDTTTGR